MAENRGGLGPLSRMPIIEGNRLVLATNRNWQSIETVRGNPYLFFGVDVRLTPKIPCPPSPLSTFYNISDFCPSGGIIQ